MAEKKPVIKPAQKRVYQGEGEIDHDLFQLKLANMKKNLGVDSKDVDITYTDIPHTHFFHTVDSDGRPQQRSVSIGGHCHEMVMIPAEDGGIPHVSCGPAVKEVRKKKNGKYVRAFEHLAYDDHTHETVYIKSNRIQQRQANADAANVVAADAQKAAPIPGVQS